MLERVEAEKFRRKGSMKEAIEKVARRINLTEPEMQEVFDEIMSGKAAQADIVAFLDALRNKGETVEEITAAAKVMRDKALSVYVDGEILVDTCGTGGTGINTFNVSTAAALVAAGCGVKIAKHGNRSASGHCGSADVLEGLGVKIDIPPEKVAASIQEVGMGFMFAQVFHAAMRHAAEARKQLKGRTIFNILGPLSNPAGAKAQVMGVYAMNLTEIMARVLKNLDIKRAFVVHGMDGLDEITITDKTKITELESGRLKTYLSAPEDFGVKTAQHGILRGGGVKENVEIVLSILKGEKSPRRDVVLMNASAAIICGGKAKNTGEGMKMAAESIDSLRAMDKLTKLIEFTNK